jgi:hypothetical protein
LGATYVPPSSMAWQLGHSRRHFRDEWSAQRACAVRVLVLHPSREGRRRLPSESPAFCESPLHPLGPTSEVMNEPSSHSSTDSKSSSWSDVSFVGVFLKEQTTPKSEEKIRDRLWDGLERWSRRQRCKCAYVIYAYAYVPIYE